MMLKRLAIALAACLAASPADAQLLSWTTPDHAQVTPSPLFSDFLPVYRGPNFPPLYSTMANLPLALSQPLFGGTAVLFNGALYNNANHDPTHDQAGYSTGFWLADINPASAQYGANPAAGGAIVGSMFVDNLNNRSHGFWDLNLGVIQWGLSSGGAFSQGRGIEIDVDQSISSGITPTDPMSCGPCVDPIELIASQNTDPQTTNPERALLIWSVQPPSGNNTWFRTGVVMSRVLGSGLWFGDDTDDGDAAGTSFRRAAIEDASSSARVLYLSGGSHTTIFDFTGLTNTNGVGMFMPGGYDSIFRITNGANHGVALTLDSGNNATENTQLKYSDQATDEWVLRKFTNDHLQVFDVLNGAVRMDFDQAGDLGITAAVTVTGTLGATAFKVGATAGASCTLTTVSHLTVANGIVTLCN